MSPIRFPGLGFTCAFVGLILQLVHDLNKNVYTVNPQMRRRIRCGLSREDGLFLLGSVLVRERAPPISLA